ncbi:hypothetical protein JKP88DRAFT_153606, partial [Tribonema minus]
ETNLKVAPSTIPGAGLGLFSVKTIEVTRAQRAAGVRIIKYTGEQLTNEQVNARYGVGPRPYVLGLRRPAGMNVDARSTQSSVARYCNAGDRPGHGLTCNARFTETGWLVATRTIPAGAEIITKYGGGYWRSFN